MAETVCGNPCGQGPQARIHSLAAAHLRVSERGQACRRSGLCSITSGRQAGGKAGRLCRLLVTALLPLGRAGRGVMSPLLPVLHVCLRCYAGMSCRPSSTTSCCRQAAAVQSQLLRNGLLSAPPCIAQGSPATWAMSGPRLPSIHPLPAGMQ